MPASRRTPEDLKRAAKERENICAKIRALQAKTVENGCTEDEAIAAAAKVADLLDAYDLDLDEVEIRETAFTREEIVEDAAGDRLWKPADAIARLTNTRYWISRRGAADQGIVFFGFEHEVAIASYLFSICARAMRTRAAALDQDLSLFRLSVRRRQKASFLDGMATRLAQRILALKRKTPTGRGLVLLREKLLEDELQRLGLKLRFRHLPELDIEASYARGVRAAEDVALDPGLHGAEKPKALLKSARD